MEPADTPDPIPGIDSNPVAGKRNAAASSPQRGALPDFRIGVNSSRWNSAEIRSIEIQPHWSVPWADLMMVMMVMFAVMFVSLAADRDAGESSRIATEEKPRPLQRQTEPEPRAQSEPAAKPVTEGQHMPISAEEILRLSEKLVADANLDEVDVVLTENQAVKVSVRGNLLFDLGRADLKPEAISFLDKLAQIIAANNYMIEVVGHTDNFPISNPAYPTNWELSSARSARVARYLIETGNIEPGRFAVIGHAFYRPAVPNTSLESKARNRRVEIVITRNEYKP